MNPDDRRIMVDIETLSTRRDAAIIAVAAVEFDVNRVYNSYIGYVDPKKALGHQSVSTLAFWENQSPKVKAKVWNGTDTTETILNNLRTWMTGERCKMEVWANSPSFDLVILESSYEAINSITPFIFYKQRDMRTLLGLVDEIKGSDRWRKTTPVPYPGDGNPHEPYYDCVKQILGVQHAISLLSSSH